MAGLPARTQGDSERHWARAARMSLQLVGIVVMELGCSSRCLRSSRACLLPGQVVDAKTAMRIEKALS